MSPRVIGLVGGVVVAMAIVMAFPPDDVRVAVFGTLALVALLCAGGWLIGSAVMWRYPVGGEERYDDLLPDPPGSRKHVFVGAGVFIVLVVLLAQAATHTSQFALWGLVLGAGLAGLLSGAAFRAWERRKGNRAG